MLDQIKYPIFATIVNHGIDASVLKLDSSWSEAAKREYRALYLDGQLTFQSVDEVKEKYKTIKFPFLEYANGNIKYQRVIDSLLVIVTIPNNGTLITPISIYDQNINKIQIYELVNKSFDHLVFEWSL